MFFSLHHLKVPNKGRCTLWGSWHPTTAWGSSQTVQSQFLSSQDSILSLCWKELQNKTWVSSTGCLFTVNRPTFCSLSPPLFPQKSGGGKDLPPRFHESYPRSSAEESHPKSQQQQRNPPITKWTKSHPYKLMEEIAIKSYYNGQTPRTSQNTDQRWVETYQEPPLFSFLRIFCWSLSEAGC